MNKAEIIKRFGKNDGHDEDRYDMAVNMSANIDQPIFICFEGLVNLENKGSIELVVEGE